MSESTPSYGSSLPDSETLIDGRAKALIELLPTIAGFVSTRANLEKEFGRKIIESSTKARAQALKEESSRGGGSKAYSLQTAYLEIISATEWDGRHSVKIADALEKEVSQALINSAAKFEGIRKKQHQFSSKLTSERDRTVSDYEKSKQRYFDACADLEAARVKRSLAKDERSEEKAKKVFDLAQVDMEVAKNQFLLDVHIANAAKVRLYNVDSPALHDDYQLLESATVRQLVTLLAKFGTIAEDTFQRRHEAVTMADEATKKIDVIGDQQNFVDAYSPAKLESWALPRDVIFEEAAIWHDSREMSTTPSSINFLQNVKIKASTRLATIGPSVDSKNREIAGLRNLRDAYEKDPKLGDSCAVLENLMESVRTTTTLEIEQTQLKAQIELINDTLGDDEPIALRLHDLKSTSFVAPVNCVVCQSTCWGKGLSCKQCGVSLHTKCELKIPAGCGSAAGGLARNRSGSVRSTGRTSIDTTSSGRSRDTPPPPVSPIGGSFSPEGGRRVPPAFGAPPPGTVATATPIVVEVQRSATVMFDYQASTAFELTVQEGDAVTVVEDEDDAGWSKVLTLDGRRGQVPASYIQINEGGGVEIPEEEGAVEEARKQVVALYDYTAQSGEELSIVEGEYLELSDVGLEFGEGWVEVIKEGKVGLVPSTYVEAV